jgi:AraC family transcriptional regulator
MRVEVEVLGRVEEPYRWISEQNMLGLQLRAGSIEAGVQRFKLNHLTFEEGEMGLCPRYLERWVGCGDMVHLILTISDSALKAASDGASDKVELRHELRLVDQRLAALTAAVNAERIAGFPSGQLFLDSVEQAMASALVDGYAVRQCSARKYRGGLGPARLRKIREFVCANMEEELRLREMAQSVGLSTTHFSQMFRRSTGESPHQFVLRQRIERGKQMLRAAEGRILDIAIACGFKTQQHFARVFRKLCGASPTEYREEFVEAPSGYAMEDGSHDTPILASAGLGQVNNSSRQA